jgi:itaconate CoA-transferase
VQNLAPATAVRLHLDAEQVRARHPSLIACDISGYGNAGPLRDKKAYDLLVQCEAGVVAVTGTPEAPAKAGISVADIAAGMYAYSTILGALYGRERSGEGATCRVSLFDSLVEWMGHPLYYTMYSGSPPARTGTSHSSIEPYGSYRARDGHVQLGVQNEREWRRFCVDVLRSPDLLDDGRFVTNARRVEHRMELGALVEQILGGVEVEEVLSRLDGAGIANGKVNSVPEVLQHPQLEAGGRWTEIDSPVGRIRALRPPVRVDGLVWRMARVPAVGEHTEAILSEIGWKDELEALRQAGAI